MKNNLYANVKTGEIEAGMLVSADVMNNYKLINLRSVDAHRRSTEEGAELQKFNESLGKYYTLTLRERINELFSNELFNDTERVAIMYLGSFVGFDGYLITKNKIPMNKKLISKYVKITTKDNRFNDFYKKLIETEIIAEVDGKLKWDTKLSFKGRPEIYGNKIKHCYKTYDQTMQELYETNKPKQLATVFRLLPYVNKFSNELCKTVDKPTYSVDDLYLPQEVAELLGITDSMGKKNFVRRALTIKVGKEYVFMVSKVGKVAKVTVNPKLVWMNSIAPDHTLLNLFELANERISS
ncbi:hypothetical protein [Neobacillus sp. SuZ13]|uniref:hypothetical protein n=1 Tax=Neobacillus sp. SuZ13 TaxID=3047875 RepID=UPI0024BF67C9|nr:hypothetical protein [Neobacillus sp. SuZ13]WHY64706.1 hypothetical protein QNH17_16395 [Neobacillus sp. SuZ13]